MSTQYWIELYAQAEQDDTDDDTAVPEQDSELGQQYYYIEDPS